MTTPAHGHRGSQTAGWNRATRPLGWAALGGIVASILIGVPMHQLGMITMGPARLVGSGNVWIGWLVHLIAGALFSLPYGFLARTASYARNALLGALYGLAIGVLFAWLALFAILGMPFMSQMAAIDVALHVAWGAVVGLVTAWGLHRGAGTIRERRRTTGLAR